MQEILELQTGQVAFLSGLLSGFSLSIAVHILRHGIEAPAAKWVFSCLLITTVLFLVSLYVDVGTNAATAAFVLFLISIGLLGWIASPVLGLVSTIVAAIAFVVLGYVWFAVQHIF